MVYEVKSNCNPPTRKATVGRQAIENRKRQKAQRHPPSHKATADKQAIKKAEGQFTSILKTQHTELITRCSALSTTWVADSFFKFKQGVLYEHFQEKC